MNYIYSRTFFLLYLFFFLSFAASAQNTCPHYNNLIKEGDAAFRQTPPDYKKAMNQYNAAILYCPTRAKEAQKKIEEVFEQIQKLQKEAVFQREIANKERDEAESQRKKADSVLRVVEKEQAKNQQIIGAFYFYEGRFALAYKGGRYGFINKEGKLLIGYNYTEATPFDKENGFARVKKVLTQEEKKQKVQPYFGLMDTSNFEKPYRLATEMSELGSEIEAADFRNNNLTTFPMEIIRKCPNLKVLLLSNNHLKSLPTDSLNLLQELKYLDLGYNEIENISPDLNLPRLTTFDLRGNQLSIFGNGIGKLANLRKLVLSENKRKRLHGSEKTLMQLHEEIGQLSQLKILLANNNHFTALPTSVSQLKNLEKLGLADNELTDISPLLPLSQLKNLDISHNPIKRLPKEIETNGWKLLRVLNLELCGLKMTNTENSLASLENLGYLYLSGNNFEGEMPNYMYNLQKLKILDVSNCNIYKSLSNHIANWDKMDTLDLSQNTINSLPLAMARMEKLSNIILDWGEIDSLPDFPVWKNITRVCINEQGRIPKNFHRLIHLRKLELLGVKLEILPEALWTFKELEYLSMFANGISEISPKIGQFENLTHLEITANKINSLPSQIQNLKKLTYLNLRANPFSTFPMEIFAFKELETLYLDDIPLKTIPPQLGFFQRLKFLSLQNDSIESLPSEIKNLAQLEQLRLNVNELHSLPSEIYQLKALKVLELDNNKIRILPKEIGYLGNLRTLMLKNNQIKTFPSELSKLENLQLLQTVGNQNLKFSQIAQILSNQNKDIALSFSNEDILLNEWAWADPSLNLLVVFADSSVDSIHSVLKIKNLLYLDLKKTGLTAFPNDIKQLQKLKFLDMSELPFKEIPSEIKELQNLKSLVLRNMKIDKLPDAFCELKNLERLSLQGNTLNTLPNDFDKLKKLFFLDISYNQFAEIPKHIINLPLMDFRFIGNPLNNLSSTIFRNYSYQAIEWCAEMIEARDTSFMALEEDMIANFKLALELEMQKNENSTFSWDLLLVGETQKAVELGERELQVANFATVRQKTANAYMMNGDLLKAKELFMSCLSIGSRSILTAQWSKLKKYYAHSPTHLGYIAEMEKWLAEYKK